jgi:hypothetical protein
VPPSDRLRHGRLRYGRVDLPLGATVAPHHRRGCRVEAAMVRGRGRGGRGAASERGWGLPRSSGLMGLTGPRALPCLGPVQHGTRALVLCLGRNLGPVV